MKHKANDFWTQDEVDELYAGARQIAEDLDLDDEFVDTVVRRAMDAREFPEMFLTIDQFVERCEEMGIYCSHCGNADSDCQWCVNKGPVCKSCQIDYEIYESGLCRECYADAVAYQTLEDNE